MTNILKVEFLKTKHSVVRLLVWLLPLIAVLMMTAVFWDNQYLVQLMMGQWSYFWLNMSIGLLVGLSTYYQKQATKFREILTSPQDLLSYEIGRILHGIIQACIMSVIFIVLMICVRLFFKYRRNKLNDLFNNWSFISIFMAGAILFLARTNY